MVRPHAASCGLYAPHLPLLDVTILDIPMMMTSIALTLCYKLPFPLINNHNSLNAAAAAALSSPKGAAPQTAAPSSCAMKSHTAAAKSPPH